MLLVRLPSSRQDSILPFPLCIKLTAIQTTRRRRALSVATDDLLEPNYTLFVSLGCVRPPTNNPVKSPCSIVARTG